MLYLYLYLYSKDNTPTPGRPALLRESMRSLSKINALAIGISRDSVAPHKKFAEKHGLPFILLTDPERTTIQVYGVWQEKSSMAR